ncbi:MAG: hypothetical protein JST85_15485 [Acidobacteria bacterium]|nr:hypothetical protein [Acidobacteriota bacterium]
MKNVLLAGILGGIVAFICSAAIHMSPLGMMGLSVLNGKEEAVLTALKSNIQNDGLYFFPGVDMSKSLTKEEEAAWEAKYKAGPIGLLLYHPTGSDTMSPKQLGTELLSTIICALIAAFILASTVGSLTSRAILVGLIGLFVWFAISISYWNWYGFPFKFILLDLVDQVIGWTVAGFVMAKMVKPANQ